MFSKALAQVEQYTLPVVFSRRHFDGRVSSAMGTCIILNRDGWLLTAHHMTIEMAQIINHAPEISAFEKERNDILNDPKMHPNDKKKRLRSLKENPLWVTNQAIMWKVPPQSQVRRLHSNALADISIGRLEPFDAAWVKGYPVFKNPAEAMLPGTSLCRLGFPFHQISATFIENTKQFQLAPTVFPIPRFPNEGIHTRIAMLSSPNGQQQVRFIETSSAGLKGQSGGPIFDCNGHVWAMQSRTQSLALGIAPEVVEGKTKIVEHQFMHVGWGTHVEEIIKFCRQFNVAITLSS